MGTGYSQLGIWRASAGTWFILDQITGSTKIVQYGTFGDIPLEGDFDGGIFDIAIFRPSNATFYILKSSNNEQLVQAFGNTTDIPTTACYTFRRMQLLGLK